MPIMLIFTHLAITLLIGKSLVISRNEWIVALIAGIGIDIDHLLVNSKWIDDIRNFIRYGRVTHGKAIQHSWIQEPLSGMLFGCLFGWILYLSSLSIRWWILPFFLAVHILMDALMKYEHRPFAPFSNWNYTGFVPSATVHELWISIVLLVMVLL